MALTGKASYKSISEKGQVKYKKTAGKCIFCTWKVQEKYLFFIFNRRINGTGIKPIGNGN